MPNGDLTDPSVMQSEFLSQQGPVATAPPDATDPSVMQSRFLAQDATDPSVMASRFQPGPPAAGAPMVEAPPAPGSDPFNPYAGLSAWDRVRKGFLLGASRLAQESLLNQQAGKLRHQQLEDQVKMDAFTHLIQSGKPVTPDVVKSFGLDPKQTTVWNMIAAQNRTLVAEEDQRMREFMGGAAGGGAPTGTAGTAAGTPRLAPGVTLGPAQPGETATAPASRFLAPPPPPLPAVRPSATLTRKTPTGATMSVTQPGVTPEQQESIRAGRERLAMEQERFPVEQAKRMVDLEKERVALARARFLEARENVARASVQSIMERARAATTPEARRAAYDQALEVAAGAGLKDVETLLKSHATAKGEELDLSKPAVAEAVAATGLNPKTLEPVDAKTHRAAVTATKARTARIIAQNEAIQKVGTQEAGTRTAVTGAIKSLAKESETVGKFTEKVSQIEGALDLMEKNLSVYPETVLGKPSAMFSQMLQNDRGRTIYQIQQAINVLQSAEARFMAGEVGRIPYQLEKQWREVLADPTKVTRKTAQQLIVATRARLRDMAAGKTRAVEHRAGVASRLGVPKSTVEAYRQGDTEALGMAINEGVRSGALPPILNDEDIE